MKGREGDIPSHVSFFQETIFISRKHVKIVWPIDVEIMENVRSVGDGWTGEKRS
jgi:hypothetical protein